MEGRLRIAFLGTAQFAVPTLQRLARGPDGVIAVVTRPDRPAGRGRKLRASPVKVAARNLGLPIHQPARVSSVEGIDLLDDLLPDLLVVCAYGEILSEEALGRPRLGAVNLHASLLPRWRGAAPIQRAILAGDEVTGVTVQWMARELDAGDIILARATTIEPEEEFGSLHDRLACMAAEAMEEALELIRQGSAPRVAQDLAGITHAPPIRSGELVLDWRRPAEELARVVRAFAPRPGARTTRGGELVKVLRARAEAGRGGAGGEAGRVSEVRGEGFLVECGEGRLRVLAVQPAGGRPMSAADYVRGRGLREGERLGVNRVGAGPVGGDGGR